MASVTLAQVSKTYKAGKREHRAVVGLDLPVQDRELLVIVGPSACGKTTTLRLIAGLETPDSGAIRIGERVVNDDAPRDRNVAMVFQNGALYPHMTVFDNLAFGLRMRGTRRSEVDRLVREAAARLGIADLLGRKPAALSGGEEQRVAVGRAIVRSPNVFLFDEPLSSLDARLRVDMRSELKQLQRQLCTTTIYVTHDQEEAMVLADRLAVMREGRIRQLGTPDELYHRPADRFVAGFLGTPMMNFLAGRLVGGSSEWSFSSPLGRWRLPGSFAQTTIRDGVDAVLGVRAEHVTIVDETVSRWDSPSERTEWGECAALRVRSVESLGWCRHVELAGPGETKLVARTAHDARVELGGEARVRVDLSHVHLFLNDEPGERIE